MICARRFATALFASLGLVLVCASVHAADAPKADISTADAVALPKPADVQALAIYPPAVALRGSDASQQMLVTASLAGGRLQDLSCDVSYDVADAKVVRVSSSGRVTPLASGTTEITARFGDKSLTVPVRADQIETNLPINFGNQVVPVFTKLGCNSGGCHGKASGQNGFKLSLLGFEPDVDFASLVKEARGRRLFPAAPDYSLLLLKMTGTVAHAGGKRTEVGSDEYKVVRRWIAAGTPFGKAADPVVTHITVYPEHRIMARQNKQQFAVYAHYSDKTIEDITRRAQYESNDTEIASVDPSALVHTMNMSGEAAIMARYQGKMAVFRATVPNTVAPAAYQFVRQNLVDDLTHKKWRQLGLQPSEICPDEQFIRRVSLDITGTLPTPEAVKAFLDDKAADKRAKLVDRLLETPEYSYYFANKWADILHVKRRQQINSAQATFGFHGWIRDAMTVDKPYDEFAREILTATGDEFRHAPTVWYKELQTPERFVDDTAQVFLGLRLACAQCHHHPYEKWSQDDYWGIAAFFGRIGRKNIPLPGDQGNGQPRQLVSIVNRPSGTVQNKRTGQAAVIKPLDADPITVEPGEDPRQRLVDWMAAKSNPFFARAVVNRYWAHFFTRGIVDPPDDMRVTNPPSNPELLDALAKDLVEHRFSLKHLIRTICKSATYQLSAVPNEFNKHDKQAYARYYPKRMGAEVLYDALCQVTDSPGGFGGVPQDRHAPKRAIMLPDESFASYFLDVFGRPQRLSACECERVSEANLAQALHLLNSDEVQGKLARAGGRADVLAKDPRPDADKIDELFLWAFAHRPSPEQKTAALGHLERHAKDKKVGYENILWALLNTKEFVFNQ